MIGRRLRQLAADPNVKLIAVTSALAFCAGILLRLWGSA